MLLITPLLFPQHWDKEPAYDKVEATRGFGQEKITLFILGYILLLYLITCQIENTVAFQNKSNVHLINYGF